VALNFEAEAGSVPRGPVMRLEVTPAQLVMIQASLAATSIGLAQGIALERNVVVKRSMLDGLKRLLDLRRLLAP
jgi:hypothetical protein